MRTEWISQKRSILDFAQSSVLSTRYYFQAGILSPVSVLHQGAQAKATTFTEMFCFVGLTVMVCMDSAIGDAAASASALNSASR